MVVGLLGAPDVVELHLHIDRRRHAIEERDFAEGAQRPTFTAGAVVAVLVDDQRVVQPAEILEGLKHAAGLVIVVGHVRGEHLNLADEELLRLGGELVPGREEIVRPGCKLKALGNHTELLLVLKDGFAQLFVAVVEQVHRVDFVHPLLLRMMRRMGSAGHVIEEERLVGIGLVDAVHPIDSVVGHRGNQVPFTRRLACERIDLRGVAEQVRPPLVGIAADETVEIIETHAVRPLGERPGLAGLVGRGVVILAEPRRRIAIVAQDAAYGGIVHADDTVVAGVAGGLFGYHAETDRVVIAPGEGCGPGRRAQRRREHAVVAQAAIGDAVHGRRRDDPAEGAGNTEPRIVSHDEQDVRRVLGRYDARRPPLGGVDCVILDHTAEFRLRRGQLLAVDSGGGAG